MSRHDGAKEMADVDSVLVDAERAIASLFRRGGDFLTPIFLRVDISRPPARRSVTLKFVGRVWYYTRLFPRLLGRMTWPALIPCMVWLHFHDANPNPGDYNPEFGLSMSLLFLVFGVILWACTVFIYNAALGVLNASRPPLAYTGNVTELRPMNRVGTAKPLGEARFARPAETDAALGGQPASSSPALCLRIEHGQL